MWPLPFEFVFEQCILLSCIELVLQYLRKNVWEEKKKKYMGGIESDMKMSGVNKNNVVI